MEERDRKDLEIHELKERMYKMQQNFGSYGERLGEIVKKVEQEREWQKHEDERRHVLYDMLDKELPRWKEKYYPLIGLERNLTPEVRKKIEGFLENLGNKSDSDDYDDDD